MGVRTVEVPFEWIPLKEFSPPSGALAASTKGAWATLMAHLVASDKEIEVPDEREQFLFVSDLVLSAKTVFQDMGIVSAALPGLSATEE